MFGYRLASANTKVAKDLRLNPNGERAELVMLLTFQDGRELPVNYLREGDQVFVGADGRGGGRFGVVMCQSLYSSRAKSYPGERDSNG